MTRNPTAHEHLAARSVVAPAKVRAEAERNV